MGVPNTFSNGTVADATQVNANFADVEAAFSTYKHVLERNGGITAATAQTYLLGASQLFVPSGSGGNSTTGGALIFYLDPADYAAGGRTTKYRLRAHCYTNATAPTITFTVGLYPVSAVAGVGGALTWTLGTVTSGSTVAFTTQALSTRAPGSSGDFTAPAAGHYAIGVVASGSQASNSLVTLGALLQVRQV